MINIGKLDWKFIKILKIKNGYFLSNIFNKILESLRLIHDGGSYERK